MTRDLLLLEWTTIGGCILAAAVIAGAFAASVVSELRRRPAVHWAHSGEWYGRTEPATTPLGQLPAAVEAELAKLAALIPDRPA